MSSVNRKCPRCKRKKLHVVKSIADGQIFLCECLSCKGRIIQGNAYVKGWPEAQRWLYGTDKRHSKLDRVSPLCYRGGLGGRMGYDIEEAGTPLASFLDGKLVGGPTPWGIHRWKDLFRCPRRYYYRYIKRLVAGGEKSEALLFGELVHEMLAHYYRRENPYSVLDDLKAEGYAGQDLVQEADRVFKAYRSYYPKHKDPYWRGVKYKSWIERYCQMHEKLTCRIDLIYERPGGIVVVDHKTSRAMTAQLTSGFEFDAQMLGISWAATVDRKLSRHKFLFVEINAIVRTQVPQFKRVRHRFSKSDVMKFRRNFALWENKLEFEEANNWPMTHECIDKYRRKCEYIDACMYGNESGLTQASKEAAL